MPRARGRSEGGDERQAEDATLTRKEYEMWDNGAERTVTNQGIREKRGLKVSPKDTEKDAKQEIIYSRHGDRQSDKG